MADAAEVEPAVAERRRIAALAGHTRSEPAALAALADADPSVRAVALGALHRLGALAISQLVDALADHPIVARRAIELSARTGADEDLDAALLAVLTGGDAALVEAAAWALGERHQEDDGAAAGAIVAALCPVALTHEDALCRESAVAALGAIAHPDGLPAILAATRDRTTVRRRAVIALAPYEGPEVDAALAHARQDRDWQVRQAAEDLSDIDDTGDAGDTDAAGDPTGRR